MDSWGVSASAAGPPAYRNANISERATDRQAGMDTEGRTLLAPLRTRSPLPDRSPPLAGTDFLPRSKGGSLPLHILKLSRGL